MSKYSNVSNWTMAECEEHLTYSPMADCYTGPVVARYNELLYQPMTQPIVKEKENEAEKRQ